MDLDQAPESIGKISLLLLLLLLADDVSSAQGAVALSERTKADIYDSCKVCSLKSVEGIQCIIMTLKLHVSYFLYIMRGLKKEN